jgi:trk system potassium uptake protein TrkA
MRIALIGAGQFTVTAARTLLEDGHEVVIVDEDQERLTALEEQDLDCGLMHGDGSRPAVLKELGPGNTDFLFCMSGSDQDNILAALAGVRLGFGRVVVMIQDPDFGDLCAQLGLDDVLIPSQETANAVTDRVAGIESVDLAPLLESGLRFFSFAARESEAGSVGELDLPKDVRVLAVVGDDSVGLADGDTRIREGDRVYALCSRERVEELHERFSDP